MEIYGKHPVLEAIENGIPLEKVFILKGIDSETEKVVRANAGEKNIPVQTVPREKFQKWRHLNHQGLLAVQSAIAFHELEDIVPSLLADEKQVNILVLDNITDVRNMGAIARSAVCFGVSLIIIPTKGSARIGAEAIKSSAGALQNIPICRVNNLASTLGYLQNNDIYLYASDLKATQTIKEVPLDQHKAILIGSEGKGVSSHLLKAADQTFLIPQVADFDSLNVSVATGIMLYELLAKK